MIVIACWRVWETFAFCAPVIVLAVVVTYRSYRLRKASSKALREADRALRIAQHAEFFSDLRLPPR